MEEPETIAEQADQTDTAEAPAAVPPPSPGANTGAPDAAGQAVQNAIDELKESKLILFDMKIQCEQAGLYLDKMREDMKRQEGIVSYLEDRLNRQIQ